MIFKKKLREFSDVRGMTKNTQAMNTKNITDIFTPKYIDPMHDFGFKKIFKESGRKELLIRPLNVIFGLDIADIEIRDGERLGETPEDRSACFDLFCVSSDGKRFIVEVQLFSQPHFLDRAVYYTTFPIAESARKGVEDGRSWDFAFPPVFFLGLLNFDFRKPAGHGAPGREKFIHRYSLREDRTGELMTDRLHFAFLEIGRFDKGREECASFEDRFLYMMKNLPTFAESPAEWEDPYFRTMLKEAEFAGMSREQKDQYRKEMRRDWDYKNTMDHAVARGREEGIAQGHAQGLAEGISQEQQAIARRMLADGLPIEAVVKYTTLTEDQIRAL